MSLPVSFPSQCPTAQNGAPLTNSPPLLYRLASLLFSTQPPSIKLVGNPEKWEEDPVITCDDEEANSDNDFAVQSSTESPQELQVADHSENDTQDLQQTADPFPPLGAPKAVSITSGPTWARVTESKPSSNSGGKYKVHQMGSTQIHDYTRRRVVTIEDAQCLKISEFRMIVGSCLSSSSWLKVKDGGLGIVVITGSGTSRKWTVDLTNARRRLEFEIG